MSRLSPLQFRILRVLSAMSPPWRLTGGGALVGVHTKHRTTRDLDLFLSEVESLADTARQTEALLIADGLEVTHLATSPLHVRLLVSADGETRSMDVPRAAVAEVLADAAVRSDYVGRRLAVSA